jgi:hypothetical protein
MKLQDPRLEALLDAYRADRVPTTAARRSMQQRLQAALRRGRTWPRVVMAAVLAVAALALLWLATREWSAKLAGLQEPASDAQAPFAVEPAAGSRTAVHAGRGKVASEAEASSSGAAENSTPVEAKPALDLAAERAVKRATVPGSAPSSDAMARERELPAKSDDLALIEAAEAALRAGEPVRALALLRQHEQRFADAPTAEEREALRVLSLCALGRASEGRGARWAFLRAHPRSAYRERIENACPQP